MCAVFLLLISTLSKKKVLLWKFLFRFIRKKNLITNFALSLSVRTNSCLSLLPFFSNPLKSNQIFVGNIKNFFSFFSVLSLLNYDEIYIYILQVTMKKIQQTSTIQCFSIVKSKWFRMKFMFDGKWDETF